MAHQPFQLSMPMPGQMTMAGPFTQPPPPGTFPGPMLMGMPPQYGNTVYKYRTADGGPPSAGAPPGVPGPPPPGQMPFHWGPPPKGPPPPYPGMVCVPSGPPKPPYWQQQPLPWGAPTPAAPPGFSYAPPPPPPPPPQYQAYAAPGPPPPPVAPQAQPFQPTGQIKPPRPGTRVQGELPHYPAGKPPMIHSSDICTFHLVKSDSKPWRAPPNTPLKFEAVRAATNLTMYEFLEGIGARGEYPPNYPHQYIGVTEALDNGNGTWTEGTTHLYGDGDARLSQTLAQVGWTKERGQAGQRPPVTLVFAP